MPSIRMDLIYSYFLLNDRCANDVAMEGPSRVCAGFRLIKAKKKHHAVTHGATLLGPPRVV